MCCRSCEKGIVVVLVGDTNRPAPTQVNGDPRNNGYDMFECYPSPVVLRAPENVSAELERDYVEALDCLGRQNCTAAGVMFRKVLQRATTAVADSAGLDPFKRGTPLKHRLDALRGRGLLTDPMYNLADLIKLDGNEAAHGEDEVFDETAATRMQEFTELFLTYTFTLPARVAKAKAMAEG